MIGLVLALALDAAAMQEALEVFPPAIEVFQKAAARRAAYERFMGAVNAAESRLDEAGNARADIAVLGNRFYFDDYGELYFDDRFVRPDEYAALDRVNAFFARHFGVPVPGGAAPAKAAGQAPVRGERRRAAAAKRGIAVFKGYEAPRYQQYDDLILRYVADFNANRADWAASTAQQAAKIYDLTPEVVKAHMIEETGGNDARSKSAWAADPEQVNVPGDWNPHKAALGLREPVRRNEGTAADNVRAAIKYLVRKGFGVSGQPARNRPSGTFDGWFMALKRYNGRSDRVKDGRCYKDAYAERISKRAADPAAFVPIGAGGR